MITKATLNKKIAFVIGSMRRGGAERVISILANDYADRGWEVDILLLLDEQNDYELRKGINVYTFCTNKRSRITALPFWISRIRNYIIKKNPDKIVSFIARINLITIISAFGLKKPIVISERNDPAADGRSFIVRVATQILYPLADRIIFQTSWAKSCFSQSIQSKSTIIPNPININTIAINEKSKKIVAVGRLVEQKNHSLLIEAFSLLHQVHPEYKLYIYGDGGLRESLLELIDKNNLTDYIMLPGNTPNIHENIADAEMFVLSSNYEGMSNALLEAMMMGIPCISTNCAGSNEIIKSGENGVLVNIGDSKMMHEAMCHIIENKKEAKIMGDNGRESITYMNKENIIILWRTVIEGLND